MLPRTLEPEVMDDPDEAREYDDLNHLQVNERFVDDLLNGGMVGPDILDLGTGSAQIPVILCQRCEDVRVMAADASQEMLEVARYNLELGHVRDRIQLIWADAKDFKRFQEGMFDTVISNSLIHHIPEPTAVFQNAVRLTKLGGRIFIRDLLRPDSSDEVERLVQLHAGNESPRGQQLLRQSLHAALSLDELKAMIQAAKLPVECVQQTSDRHWTLNVVCERQCKTT